MRSALGSQKKGYVFQNYIEQVFHAMTLEEQEFSKEEAISHSHQVHSYIAEIRNQIHTLKKQAREQIRQKQLSNLIGVLDSYEKKFARYVQHILDIQTLNSRLVTESERLQRRVEEYTRHPESGRQIYLAATRAIIGQSNFTHTGSVKHREEATRYFDQLHFTLLTLGENIESDEQKLQVYRIDRAATSFETVFLHFVEQEKSLNEAQQKLREAFLELRQELSRSIAIEFQLANEHVLYLQRLIITIVIVAVLLSLIATLILSKIITQPINLLKQSAQRIVEGDLNTSVKIQSSDEIGDLGILFNHMTHELRSSFHQLEKYRDHLEELVKERTRELEIEISERENTERELQISEKRFRTFFDNSTDPILVANPSTRSFVLANHAMCSLLGYTEQELTSLSVDAIHPKNVLPSIMKTFDEMAIGKGTIAKSVPMLRNDGSTFPAEISSTIIEIGDQQFMLGCFRDISERIAAEEERLKVRKLESVGVLAGGIAHDFNNILAAVLGNVSLLLVLTDKNDKRFKLLKQLETASLRARDLTQQLLTFSKGGEPVKEVASVAQIIKESASFVLRGTNIRCDYLFDRNPWVAEVDAGQISQVIQNIVINAQHSMPDGGVITITCRNVIPTFSQAENLANKRCLEITISDQGCGIEKHLIERIFDPYFTTKTDGSGLGLAITHSIIAKHDGNISVSSSPSKGTTFSILLPAIDTPLEIPPPSVQSNTQISKISGKILIMDDDLQVREITCSLLEHLGFSVITSADGNEAISEYTKSMKTDKPIDLVIMDLTIPGGMGGKETAEKILALDPEAKLIVSSGYSHDPIMANYREFGFQNFLSKPYQLSELQSVLKPMFPTTID